MWFGDRLFYLHSRRAALSNTYGPTCAKQLMNETFVDPFDTLSSQNLCQGKDEKVQ